MLQQSCFGRRWTLICRSVNFFKADSDRSSTTRLRGQLGPGKGCSFSATAVVLGICVLTFCSAQESGASQWLFFRLDVFLVRKIIFSMFICCAARESG